MMPKEKKYLKQLVAAVEDHLNQMDEVMKQPSTIERGKRIAALCNRLELTKDRAKHFGLDIPLKKKS